MNAHRAITDPDTDAVLRDLVDAAVQEGLVDVEAPRADGWGRVGRLWARLRHGGVLQPWRLDGGPLLDEDERPVALGDVVSGLGLDGPGAAPLAADVVAAREHAGALRSGRAALAGLDRPGPGDLLPGERLAATRGRPFHPTGRVVGGWSVAEVTELGPMRTTTLAPAWVAVRRDRLRVGPDVRSGHLHTELLDAGERAQLEDLLAEAGVDPAEHQPVPVHPWQAEHVLHREFADEIARREVVALGGPTAPCPGRLHPTSSLRTLVVAGSPRHHLKLPLGVTTLGAARLLPPRYLDNGDRAERTTRAVAAADPVLARLVGLCAEGCWAGWSAGDDEFEDRPGHLAAQLRTYPEGPGDDDAVVGLPMSALAADEWDLLAPALGVDDPVVFFAGLARDFTAVLLSFLGHGVLPEVHGQNVVVRLAPGGAVAGFVLRDHDTLRLHEPWARAAGVPDPGYRIRPGGLQTLRLDDPAALVAYAQTLGFQVNLYGIADALARHHALDERVFWAALREAVESALATLALPPAVAALVDHAVLRAPSWPSRTVLRPLLDTGPSSSVSMPAGTGRVTNPLRHPADGEHRR